VQSAFSTKEADTILTVSGNLNRMFTNFLLNVQRAAGSNTAPIPIVNVLFDDASLQSCKRLEKALQLVKIECLHFPQMLPEEKPPVGAYLWAKPVILKAAVEASKHGVFLIDIDVVFHQNLLAYARKKWDENPSAVIATGSEWRTCCNTGTVFVDRLRSLSLVEAWVERNHEWYQRELGDQDALRTLLEEKADELSINTGDLRPPFHQRTAQPPPEEAAYLGTVLVFPRDEMIELCHLRIDEGIRGMAVHYNCPTTHLAHEETLKEHGNWSEAVDAFSNSKPEKNQYVHTFREKVMREAGDWLEGADLGARPPPRPAATDALEA